MANNSKVLYVEVTFSDEDINILRELFIGSIPNEELYFSDDMEHISGMKLDNLHLTLFFGSDSSEIENSDYLRFIESINLKEVNVVRLKLISGYNNLYKILLLEIEPAIEIVDIYNSLLTKFKIRREYIHDELYPHITIAYLSKDFNLTKLPNIQLPKKLKVENIKVKEFDV